MRKKIRIVIIFFIFSLIVVILGTKFLGNGQSGRSPYAQTHSISWEETFGSYKGIIKDSLLLTVVGSVVFLYSLKK